MGRPGKPGPPGPDGNTGADAFDSHRMIVRHSQDARQPGCPQGAVQLWTGYSLMYTVGNDQPHVQDLGSGGSCMKSYSALPFMMCSLSENGCKYASRNDYSYWLAGNVNQGKQPISNKDAEQFISKCVVCETQSLPFAVHSQDKNLPDCPQGFESLWTGYSFLMLAGKGKTGAGQQLSSAGSCLSRFVHSPAVECQGGRGSCSFFADKFSFWLTTIDKARMFDRPGSSMSQRVISVNRGREVLNRVSRCRVCMKRRRQTASRRYYYMGYFAKK